MKNDIVEIPSSPIITVVSPWGIISDADREDMVVSAGNLNDRINRALQWTQGAFTDSEWLEKFSAEWSMSRLYSRLSSEWRNLVDRIRLRTDWVQSLTILSSWPKKWWRILTAAGLLAWIIAIDRKDRWSTDTILDVNSWFHRNFQAVDLSWFVKEGVLPMQDIIAIPYDSNAWSLASYHQAKARDGNNLPQDEQIEDNVWKNTWSPIALRKSKQSLGKLIEQMKTIPARVIYSFDEMIEPNVYDKTARSYAHYQWGNTDIRIIIISWWSEAQGLWMDIIAYKPDGTIFRYEQDRMDYAGLGDADFPTYRVRQLKQGSIWYESENN